MAAENIALANGSSETIDAMMRIFLQPGDEFLCSIPTFEMFPSRAGLCGATTVQIPLREEDLQYDVEGMLAAVTDKTKLMLIINPNNPTGIFIDDDDLIRFCELGHPALHRRGLPRLPPADRGQDRPPQEVPARVPLAHPLEGLRPGRRPLRLRGRPPEVVEAFNRMYLPWNVSLMAMAAAEAILDNPEEVAEKVKYNNRWMDIFAEELEGHGPQALPAARQLHAHRRQRDRQDHRRDRRRPAWRWSRSSSRPSSRSTARTATSASRPAGRGERTLRPLRRAYFGDARGAVESPVSAAGRTLHWSRGAGPLPSRRGMAERPTLPRTANERT